MCLPNKQIALGVSLKRKRSFEVLGVVPVLPNADIKRDIKWYRNHLGFDFKGGDHIYGILMFNRLILHLQRHANNKKIQCWAVQ